MKTKANCFECRSSEAVAATSIRRYTVTNPSGGPAKTGYLCEEHVTALLDDGFNIQTPGHKKSQSKVEIIPFYRDPELDRCPFCHEIATDKNPCQCF